LGAVWSGFTRPRITAADTVDKHDMVNARSVRAVPRQPQDRILRLQRFPERTRGGCHAAVRGHGPVHACVFVVPQTRIRWPSAGGPEDFPDIQSAVDRLASGDRIEVSRARRISPPALVVTVKASPSTTPGGSFDNGRFTLGRSALAVLAGPTLFSVIGNDGDNAHAHTDSTAVAGTRTCSWAGRAHGWRAGPGDDGYEVDDGSSRGPVGFEASRASRRSGGREAGRGPGRRFGPTGLRAADPRRGLGLAGGAGRDTATRPKPHRGNGGG
jgi:hypothetical protein